MCSFLILNFVPSHVADCPARLTDQGYKFECLSSYDGTKCGIKEPIKLHSTLTTALTSSVTLSCPYPKSFGDWAADVDEVVDVDVGYSLLTATSIPGSALLSGISWVLSGNNNQHLLTSQDRG